MTKARVRLGRAGEALAAQELVAAGYEIVTQNYRCTAGEIDLVTRHGEDWVFVEVRTRSSKTFGTPEDSITLSKQQRLIQCAEYYLDKQGLGDVPWRIDVVAVEMKLIGEVERFEIIPDAVGE